MNLIENLIGGLLVHECRNWLLERRVREHAPLEGDAHVLRNGRIGLVAISMVAGVTAVLGVLVFREEGFRFTSDVKEIAVVSAVLAAVAVLVATFTLTHAVRLRADGVERRFLGRRSFIAWKEIRRVDRGIGPYFIILTDVEGRRMQLSFLMRGSGTLAQRLISHLPAVTWAAVPELQADLARWAVPVAQSTPLQTHNCE